ncbi:hypothetical protein [Pseudoxanthomonas wuyuanensis]|uniref:Uncharacterized protein n=1 Tax=Pseudoxanthomonas wuyuanensis TaxID=1073196 RepID=A0A286D6W1_9GAMM|nr:hypothetical protein [Pseudoxanthomonas wuyuanensis]KAF1715295.1 hypothetical protein CSC75_20090 [Pseudoxanthomonas wuyuanensis]SOD54403.1 hypothetical protein SAMN06296416_1047 [Pseudoxanthomonas wuyuanensis]
MSASLSPKSAAPPAFGASATPAGGADERCQLLRSLLADAQWNCEPPVRERLHALMGHLSVAASSTETGPCESDWALLAHELERYLDFRRLRHLEARLRGCGDTDFRFTRADWHASRVAEAALEAHHRRVRDGSYVPEAVPMFRIH